MVKMIEVDLAVVIVSWNTCALLRQCLLALGTNDSPITRQVIVVDNASTDASAEMVAQEFPQVTLIRNADNLGFSRANNVGIAQTQSRYVVLLNSDTIVSGDTFAALTTWMDAHPDVGICSPKLLTASGEAQAYAFGEDPTIGYLLKRGLKRVLLRQPLHNWDAPHEQDWDWVSGACMVIRREVLDQLHGLDDGIFMFFEDNDFCLRARQRQWRITYVPQFSITHIGGQSTKNNPAPKSRQAYQNGLRYFYRKHYSALAQSALSLFLLIYMALIARTQR